MMNSRENFIQASPAAQIYKAKNRANAATRKSPIIRIATRSEVRICQRFGREMVFISVILTCFSLLW